MGTRQEQTLFRLEWLGWIRLAMIGLAWLASFLLECLGFVWLGLDRLEEAGLGCVWFRLAGIGSD